MIEQRAVGDTAKGRCFERNDVLIESSAVDGIESDDFTWKVEPANGLGTANDFGNALQCSDLHDVKAFERVTNLLEACAFFEQWRRLGEPFQQLPSASAQRAWDALVSEPAGGASDYPGR